VVTTNLFVAVVATSPAVFRTKEYFFHFEVIPPTSAVAKTVFPSAL
jgi:hypothetical protein